MKYFAVIDKKQIGPCSIEELVEAGLRPDNYVWCKGMDDWEPAKDVADICRHFRQRLFDRMHPSAPATPQAAQQRQEQAGTEEMRHMKSREFWNEVAHQVAETQPDEKEAESHKPITWYPFPLILSAIVFFPLGIPAVIYARKAEKLWSEGRQAESHEAARTGKMCGGVALCMGLLLLGALIRLVTG